MDGPITVRWQKSPQGLQLEINLPNGTSGSSSGARILPRVTRHRRKLLIKAIEDFWKQNKAQ
jgi:hypothetical protein